jgi:hypothetical protein
LAGGLALGIRCALDAHAAALELSALQKLHRRRERRDGHAELAAGGRAAGPARQVELGQEAQCRTQRDADDRCDPGERGEVHGGTRAPAGRRGTDRFETFDGFTAAQAEYGVQQAGL